MEMRSRMLHFILVLLLLLLSLRAQAQTSIPILPPPVAGIPTDAGPLNPAQGFVAGLLRNRTQVVTDEVAKQFSFCIVDGNKDRDLAFKFDAQSSQFITDCTNGGSLVNRLCGEVEIRLYFKSIANPKFLLPNVNCNATNWSLGCEPGWASGLSVPSVAGELPSDVPVRFSNPQPCCEGFFCPRALTCMIPCPLGAYCPLAKFDSDSGVCEPYGYQMTPNISSTCGGADKWADVQSAGELFCSPGSYCPSPATSSVCDKGHFCREGATVQEKCHKFTSCPKASDHQNLQVYGIFFIAILAILLVLIYSCSDQVMSFRDRRKSKKREKAATQARVQATAFERWGVRPELVKKAKSFSKELSRTFSRKRVKNSDDTVELSNVTKSDDPAFVEISTEKPALRAPPIAFAVHNQQAARQVVHSDTESQIYKYAFNEIEKERTNDVSELPMSKRPAIELAFEDLTMVLKKSGKKILANVTGKLRPGHITAIMGPSGAGKTTFLNAVAGKTASECRTTGRVYINGQQGSIRSYRKVIGFVPQDDIVHGSLTVEENLVFSAKYRLPVGLAKRERVLIMERIISSLGLNAVRDSLVGTVEKRGISGGQRKRVNVGLEMVMEPSLLILDEPTSGLDSTSSRLVLQALRREAFAGVNVVVVLHQPSYGLFQMFDNVMFLAKGGRTVYLGPVLEVESYFSFLGVKVPGRINPPDMYMDLLEGAVKPEGNPSFDPKVLPLIWIQREGLKVPDDLKEAAMNLESKYRSKRKRMEKAKTLREEAWDELKEPVVVWWDGVKHALFTVEDISGRKQPGFFKQFRLILERLAKQRFREARLVAQDYIILFLAGICVGLLSNIQDKSLGTTGYTYSIIALSLLCMIAALRTFAADKLQFWRESASGINRMAFFLAKDTVDHFNTAIKPLFYLSMFYFFNNPRSTFVSNYIITMAFIYCVTGIAYIFAILMQPSTAQLCCVFFPVVSTLIATRAGASGFLKVLVEVSYARWALEAYVVANAQKYNGVWLITRCGILQRLGYDLGNFNLCVAVLMAYGIGARCLALASLFFSNRKKQK